MGESSNWSWNIFELKFRDLIRIGIAILLIFLFAVITKGLLRKESFVIQPIDVPKLYEESGFKSDYIAEQLEQNLRDIYEVAGSSRNDSITLDINRSNDLDMNVMGIGVSTANIIYHIRDLLNIHTNYISGNITDLDGELSLNLFLTESGTEGVFNVDYSNMRRVQALDSLLFLGAKFTLKELDPYRLAVYYGRIGDHDNALKLIRRSIYKSPEESKWYYNLWGNIVKEQSGKIASIPLYKEALSLDPNFGMANTNLGWTYFALDSIRAAKKCFQTAYAVDEKNPGVNNGLAWCYIKEGNYEAAEKHFENNINNYPEVVWSYMNYAYYLRENRRDEDKLVELMGRAEKNIKDKSTLASTQANYYAEVKNDSATARHYIKRALLYNPDNSAALLTLAGLLGNQNNWERVVEVRKKLVRLMEDGYDYYNQQRNLNELAMAYYKIPNYDSSLHYVEQAIEIDPENPFPHSTLAEVYGFQGKTDLFFDRLKKAVDLGFDFRPFYKNEAPYSDYQFHPRMKELVRVLDQREAETKIKG